MTELISRQFWIISLRYVIYSVTSHCTICVSIDSHNPQSVLADLSAARVQECLAFTRVGEPIADA